MGAVSGALPTLQVHDVTPQHLLPKRPVVHQEGMSQRDVKLHAMRYRVGVRRDREDTSELRNQTVGREVHGPLFPSSFHQVLPFCLPPEQDIVSKAHGTQPHKNQIHSSH